MPVPPPTPPDRIPKYIAEGLAKQDAGTLRAIATHAEALAAHREAVAEGTLEEETTAEDDRPDDWDDDEWEAAVEGTEAPAKATLTVKTINGNDYYYYQWREGDEIRSEYVAPASPGG